MASVHSYTFYNQSHLGDDAAAISERDQENANFSDLQTTNYFACGMKQPLETALAQPNVFLNGGLGFSDAGGCNIDADSQLRIGGIQTNPSCKLDLFQRPFATVPYLGRGAVRPVVESKLQQGDFITNRKSCSTITENTFTQVYTPLVPSLKATIDNPHNLVENVADKGWVRGGMSTRNFMRDVGNCKTKGNSKLQ
jgi:hypothetical protein